MRAVCTSGASEDNWAATQFITLGTAQSPSYAVPITINVTSSYDNCACPKSYEVHYSPSASASSSAQSTASGYMSLGTVSTTSETLSFNLGPQYGGFYLGFRDQDSCSSMNRLMVYRGTCPSRSEGLVVYPETPTGTSAVSVRHQCVANTAEVTEDQLMCSTSGTWSGSPVCQCKPGHRLVGGNSCQGWFVVVHDYNVHKML